MKARQKQLFPLILLFVFLNIFFLTAKSIFQKWGIDREVLIIANILFFLISLIAFSLQRKAMQKTNPHAFVRSVMGSMMIKMFVVIIAVIIYTLLSGALFNKPSVFIALFLYIIYLAVEVAIVMKMNKQKNA
jgi:uncharacterized membrane protein